MVTVRSERTWRFLGLVAATWGLAALVAGCDESLPPRNDPLAILQVGFQADTGYVIIRDSLPSGNQGSFRGLLTNTFREVLQDSQRIRMVLDVYVKNRPEIHTQLIADRHFAEEWQFLSGELLTIPPRGTLHIRCQWSHRTGDGIWFWAFGPMTPGSTLAGDPYIESEPITLVVQGTVQGYKRVGALRVGPIESTVRYRVF